MAEYPAVTGETSLGQGRFVVFKQLEWIDAYGTARKWESAERVGDGGAVLIVARLVPSDRLVLIRQYRPPARAYVYEFPAGLIDDAEMAAAAAARELREETGYAGENMRIYPPAYTTPGLSNEAVNMVCVDVDESAEANIAPRTEFDPSENIETVLVARTDLPGFYRDELSKGHAFDAKLAAYILACSPF